MSEEIRLAELKKQVRGREPCCLQCFLALFCIASHEEVPVFRCRHCLELSVIVIDTPPEGRGKRALSYKVPMNCPFGMMLSADHTYCGPCDDAIRRDGGAIDRNGVTWRHLWDR